MEICDAAATTAPPTSLRDRANEALAFVAAHGEPDANTAFAAIALGRQGDATDRLIDAALPAIDDCYDCADFLLVPLIWARARWGDRIGPATRARLDSAILGFRYWMDEPGNDVMWFFSENHALLFHTACYLAGTLFPDARFRRSGRAGHEQRAAGRARLLAWFDHFERVEMGEWNSAPYFPIDFKGLVALLALAPDADIRERARRATLRLIEIVAMSCHRGVLTASQGRSYEHSLRPGRTLELSSIARLFFGAGGYGSHFHCLAELAVAILDHDLAPAPHLTEIAVYDGADALEWTFSQGENRIAPLYHYKTRHYAMGSVANYRPGAWGYQETVLHARIGDRPESQVWINHPGEAIVSGHARPSYWGGCGTLPRVHQYRAPRRRRLCSAARPDPLHPCVAAASGDGRDRDGDPARAGARRRRAPAACRRRPAGSGDRGPDGRLRGPLARPEERAGSCACPIPAAREISPASPRASRGWTARDGADGSIVMDDPDYGPVTCHFDGRIEAEGRVIEPSTWTPKGVLSRLSAGRR